MSRVNAHFHDNVIRRSVGAILFEQAESGKSDPPSGSGGLMGPSLNDGGGDLC